MSYRGRHLRTSGLLMIIATRAATSSSNIANIAESHTTSVSACWLLAEQIVSQPFRFQRMAGARPHAECLAFTSLTRQCRQQYRRLPHGLMPTFPCLDAERPISCSCSICHEAKLHHRGAAVGYPRRRAMDEFINAARRERRRRHDAAATRSRLPDAFCAA